MTHLTHPSLPLQLAAVRRSQPLAHFRAVRVARHSQSHDASFRWTQPGADGSALCVALRQTHHRLSHDASLRWTHRRAVRRAFGLAFGLADAEAHGRPNGRADEGSDRSTDAAGKNLSARC